MGKQLAVTVNAVHRVGSKMYLTTGGVHRKVKKAYLTNGGVHKLCYEEGSAIGTMTISYTGTMQDAGIVSMTDGKYRLLTLTSSGTLTVDTDVTAEVWMCGGGANGESGGAGGAGAYTATGLLTLSGGMAAVVGSAKGLSSFGEIKTKSVYSYTGGTGGGAGAGSGIKGTGDGVSKYPFLDSTYFKYPHCGGGGGGAYVQGYDGDYDGANGGNGGTNGGNGGAVSWVRGYSSSDGGTGGRYGGGAGGGAYIDDSRGGDGDDGLAATYYGSGGGGGGYGDHPDYGGYGRGGSGYQGVIYIRIPVNQ